MENVINNVLALQAPGLIIRRVSRQKGKQRGRGQLYLAASSETSRLEATAKLAMDGSFFLFLLFPLLSSYHLITI